MIVEQIYTRCLSQASYYIESNGEVAIIDPLREVKEYKDLVHKNNAKIKYIFETHFHADFVSGHLTLSEETNAEIIFGPLAEPLFKATIAKDNQCFKLGSVEIIALHTPGHTLESTTYLLKDKNGKDYAIFTGDTLFLGDVGRPDLAQKAANLTQEQLAEKLYDSLRQKIMSLSNHVIVYPAHGAGSACGKNMMKKTVDTLGNQKQVNYALQENMTKDQFVKEVTEDLLPPPPYFPSNVKMNKEGYESINNILVKCNKPLNSDDFERLANNSDTVVLDVRDQTEFVKSYIPKSIFIGLDGSFAPWVGTLITDIKQPILIVAPKGREEETIIRLCRVGYDNTLGYLEGGIEAWKNSGKKHDTITSISAFKFESILKKQEVPVIDVRKIIEYEEMHVKLAKHMPLDSLNSYIKSTPSKEIFYVYCDGGYRSVIAASILKAKGIHNLIDVSGGFSAIRNTEIPLVS